MSSVIDILEAKALALVVVVADLRDNIARIEKELDANRNDVRPEASQTALWSTEPALSQELERLRAERVVIRDTVRRLLKEIDRVSW